jgi:hypothetical protein
MASKEKRQGVDYNVFSIWTILPPGGRPGVRLVRLRHRCLTIFWSIFWSDVKPVDFPVPAPRGAVPSLGEGLPVLQKEVARTHDDCQPADASQNHPHEWHQHFAAWSMSLTAYDSGKAATYAATSESGMGRDQ